MKKKLFCIWIALTLALSAGFSAQGAVLNEVIEEQELMGGVTYRHIQRLESFGWVDVFAVTADLKAPGVKLEALKSGKGESFLETTYQMAVEHDALAAVNADFFAAKRGESGRGSAVGVEVRDGELKSSASVEESMNTLYKAMGDDRFYISAFAFDITVTAANGKTDKIKLVNKYDDLTGIVMYTDDWAERSVGSLGGIIEVAVDKNGTVVEKATESDPITIPEGGFVLSAHMSYNTFLLDNVNVGEPLSVDIKSSPNTDYIETAVGGGGVVVHEGKVPSSFSHTITGRQPRSAVGLDESGTVVTLVVADGRRSDSKGLTQTELGQLMVDLGCYTALNFDGGGSSTMVIEDSGEKEIVNQPSDGSPRKVTNSLGVISTAEENAPAVAVRIDCADTMFLNTALPLTPVGVDRYMRNVAIDHSNVKYSVTSGTIADHTFYPSEAGTVTVSVSCRGFTAQKEITVLSAPREMNFEEEKITLNSGETYLPVLTGKDMDGNRAQISLRNANVTVSNGAVEISGNRIVAKSKGAAIVTAEFGTITANMAVMVDGAAEISVPDNITIADTQNKASELYQDGAYRFSVFGNTRDSETLFDRFLMNNALYKMKGSSEFQVFLGANVNTAEIERVSTDYVLAKSYNRFDKGESTFITLPNVSGMVYTNNANVWTKFKADVQSAGQNLFIFLDRNFISTHSGELSAFEAAVNAAAESGKNVYVFGGGFVNKNTVDSGVRYIHTAGVFPSISLTGTSPSYIKYVLVTVNGNDVTYEYKPILGE